MLELRCEACLWCDWLLRKKMVKCLGRAKREEGEKDKRENDDIPAAPAHTLQLLPQQRRPSSNADPGPARPMVPHLTRWRRK